MISVINCYFYLKPRDGHVFKKVQGVVVAVIMW